jgi:hypothetical protein
VLVPCVTKAVAARGLASIRRYWRSADPVRRRSQHRGMVAKLESGLAIALEFADGASMAFDLASLVFDYGFNVETAGDHPVWHQSELDVMKGKQDEAAS